MTDPILTKVEGGVATLTLNRPKAMNSFDGDTARVIIDAVEAFAADEAVRTLVVASDGPVFCAGGDFNWVLTWPELDAITRKVGADSLMAAIQALESLNRRSSVALHTDSSYVRNGILSWVTKWKANGWRTAAKQPVMNVDLWQRLDAAAQVGEGRAHAETSIAAGPSAAKAAFTSRRV